MFAKGPVVEMPSTNEASGHDCFQRVENRLSNVVSSLLGTLSSFFEGLILPCFLDLHQLLLIPIALFYKPPLGQLLKHSSISFIRL